MRIGPYVAIARPDDWAKNIFIAPGVVLVYFFAPSLFTPHVWLDVGLGLVAACLVASSNYVLNELLDAEKDSHHPVKRLRPIPSGRASPRVAFVEWLLLGAAGLTLAFAVTPRFGWCAMALWAMGCVYNIPPVRTKDQPYLDVLSESVNNPIRLALGWYVSGTTLLPPLTVLLAYWMFGAFLMAVKRFAEYRRIGDRAAAARYRKSFAHYTEERLMESIFFYSALFGMLSGVFIARYHLELMLATPFVALAMAYYIHLGYKPDSPVQYPERLYRVRRLMLLSALAFGTCVALLFVRWPAFCRVFKPTPLHGAEPPAAAHGSPR